jgi:hypothetical protein
MSATWQYSSITVSMISLVDSDGSKCCYAIILTCRRDLWHSHNVWMYAGISFVSMLSVKIGRQSADKSLLQYRRLWWTSEDWMQDVVNEYHCLCVLVFGFVQSCWVCMSVCVSVLLYVCTCVWVRMCAICSVNCLQLKQHLYFGHRYFGFSCNIWISSSHCKKPRQFCL